MSYRLITKAILNVADNAPANIEVRAYAAPKGEAKGKLSLNGEEVAFKLTSGAGRGAATKFYVYVPFGEVSAYFEVDADTFAAIKSGKPAVVTTGAATAPVAETPKTDETPVVKTKRRAPTKVEDALV